MEEIRTATRAQVVKACEALNIELEDNGKFGGSYDVEIWAPKGKHFRASGAHCCVINRPDHEFTKAQVWGDVLSDIESGLWDCDWDCEQCYGE